MFHRYLPFEVHTASFDCRRQIFPELGKQHEQYYLEGFSKFSTMPIKNIIINVHFVIKHDFGVRLCLKFSIPVY